MALKKDDNSPKKGMNRDSHPSEVGNEEYTFALNANISDENGNGQVILQNDNSNIRCSGFKVGYRVIGHKYDQNRGRTYFFLKNTTTGCSEIGYIDVPTNFDGIEAIESECGCDIKVILEEPLENTSQVGYCTYNTLMSDCCQEFPQAPKCLNFDINKPIHESNVEIKDEKSGYNMYFTDNFNPPRKVRLDEIDYYYKDEEPCEDDTATCLQCEKLLLFKPYDKPCITATVIGSGGNLRAGTYEAAIAYCTVAGVELSDYQVSTNPVPIFDMNNRILAQPNLDYETNFAIEYEVTNLDERFKYFKVAIVRRNGINWQETYHKLDVYPISANKVIFATLDGSDNIDKDALIMRRPIIEQTKGLASGNGHLFHFGLKQQRMINLQPVVNLMGSMVKWATYQTKEDAYENGIIVANYKAFMRDETYPLSIKFIRDGGGETPLMPFVARPPRPDEIVEYVDEDGTVLQGGLNVDSIVKTPTCRENRRYKWQYENTATVDKEDCVVPTTIGNIEYTLPEEKTCTVSDGGEPAVVTIVNEGQVVVPNGLELISFINNNQDVIAQYTDISWEDIQEALEGEYPEQECQPEFGENCGEVTLKENQIFVISVGEQQDVVVPQPIGLYERIIEPSSCNITKMDPNTLSPEIDTTFVSNYMEVGEQVFVRNNILNASCSSVITVVAPNAINSGYFLSNKGSELTDTSLLSTHNATAYGTEFRNKLHTNAIWFRVDFTGRDKVVLQLSNFSTCDNPDDNNGSKVRLSLYTDCGSTHVPSYGAMMSLPNTGRTIELDSTDFPSGEAFITIDSEIFERVINDKSIFTLRPPCSCFAITETDVVTSIETSFTNMKFGKKQVYTSECSYSKPELDECMPVPYKKGKFSYVESVIKYPCNAELWDSSNLKIKPVNIPTIYRDDFEDQYTNGGAVDVDGYYILNSEADFQDKPIRHYKFPNSQVSPYMNTSDQNPGNFKKSTIYPIGFYLDNEVIQNFLDVALINGLITSEERLTLNKYEIYRGSRTSQKSVVAKGVLFDYRKYEDQGYGANGEDVYYPNYPLNTMGQDALNGNLSQNNSDGSNSLYAFHSPETHFYKPTLPREVSVEGYMFGKSLNYYDEVSQHPRYAVLGKRAEQLAATLAVAEIAFESYLKLSDWFTQGFGSTYGSGTIESGIYISVNVIAMATQSAFKWGKYREQWMETFRKLGNPNQFAYYSASIGTYTYMDNTLENTSRYRGLNSVQYVTQGKWKLNNKTGVPAITLNNTQREDHVMINVGESHRLKHPTLYTNYDNYDTNKFYATRSERVFGGTGKSQAIEKNTALPYVSLKNYLPGQYGTINSIDWVNTGYCGDLDADQDGCEAIFGGDTFISRFSVKRKFPFFTTTAIGQPDNTPYEYSRYFNIPIAIDSTGKQDETQLNKRYYLNYMIDSSVQGGFINTVFPTNQTKHRLDFPSLNNVFYERPPSKFYLYSYGIPHFLVESMYNCNYRYAGTSLAKDFYPHHNDVIELTQNVNVPIQEKEVFNINPVYEFPRTLNPYDLLETSYERKRQDPMVNMPNSVMWSEGDDDETHREDPWEEYKTADFYNFSTSNGKLNDISMIENDQLLARFRNGFAVFGTVDQIGDRFGTLSDTLGTGGIFRGRNMNYFQTDLGYAGTQNVAMVSCMFGHFWADASRGKVFMMAPSGGNGGSFPQDITVGVQKWFKENLPYNILKVPGMTEDDIDNSYNKVGITMGWDERSSRILLTKKDYKTKVQGVTYLNGEFRLAGNKVEITDTNVFEECSWTIGYNPLVKGWISYYSYKPNFYVGYNEYFQTGISDATGTSIWSHIPFNSSYQVFYGRLHPFTIEYPLVTKGTLSNLSSIDYWLDIRRYYNKHDYSAISDNGFNKATIYNVDQNTGQIELVKQENNDLSQSINFPKYNANNTQDLQSEISGKWSFNFLYNRLRDSRSGLPNWLYDTSNVDKTLNHKLIDYRSMYHDRLRGDYFLVRLTQDANSRFKYIFRHAMDDRNYYYQ